MKYLLHIALVSVLLSGCADTPMKEASIEDRAAKAKTASGQADAVRSDATQAAGAAGGASAPISEASAKALADGAGKTTASSGVETRGIVAQDPEAISLSGAGGKTGTQTGAGAAAGKADQAGALEYVAQPVLDPKDPKSPLAQRRLLFDYDSSAIRDEYRTLLEMHAQYLKNEKSARMILQGHADERGSREYNLALGQRRSESVYKALNLLGVPEAQMEAVSLGEEKPVSEGHEEAAWAQNRRTELLYQGE